MQRTVCFGSVPLTAESGGGGGQGGFQLLSQTDSLQYAHLSCASHSKQRGSRETVKYSREVRLRDVMSNTECETTKEGVYGLHTKKFWGKASYKSRTKKQHMDVTLCLNLMSILLTMTKITKDSLNQKIPALVHIFING